MIDSIGLFHILIAFGAFQALFLAIVFLAKKSSSQPKKLFALFLLIEGFTLIERLLGETGLMEAVPHILGTSPPLNFIKPPILFFIALTIANPKFKLRSIHLFHLIPFAIMLLMNLPFYMQSAEFKLKTVEEFINYVPSYTSFDFWLFNSFFLYIGAYILLSIKTLREYRTHVKNNKQANWYLWVLKLYSAFLAISLLYFLLQPSGLIDIPIINTLSMLLMTFLIQSIAYSFFTQESILRKSNNVIFNDLVQLSKDERAIRNKLELEKVYLTDSLSLQSFAHSLNLPSKYISDLVNQKFGKSFKTLINHYRVEEAKRIMKNEVDSDIQLIDVGLESGFNNKVSFYRVFKQNTGKSPSEYFNDLKAIHST